MYVKGMKNCQLCDLHKTRTNVLKGEGDSRAAIMLVAQAPGEMEDRQNRMFIGPSGKVLDGLLTAAGIYRSKIYMTNLLKCRLPQNRRPKLREIAACSVFLETELTRVKPRIVVPMGYYATKYIFERCGMDTFTKESYPLKIGIALPARDFVVFPLTHPTTLIHHHEYIEANIANFKRLAIMRECKWFQICPIKQYTELGMIDHCWVDEYCLGDWTRCVRYQQEEAGIPHPDHMLPDGTLVAGLMRYRRL